MKNEDILKAAQKNKSRGQEYENKVFFRGDSYALGAVLILCVVFLCVEYVLTAKSNLSVMTIGLAAVGVQLLHEGKLLHVKWRLMIGGILLLLAAMTGITYIGGLSAL